MSSQSSHHPQEVLLAQFSLYVHKGGLKPDSFHFLCNLSLYLYTPWASSARRKVIPCAAGAVACSGCAVLSPVGPSALSASHGSCLAEVLGVAESLAPVAL